MITNAHTALLELHREAVLSMREDNQARPIPHHLERIKLIAEMEELLGDLNKDFANPLISDGDPVPGGAA